MDELGVVPECECFDTGIVRCIRMFEANGMMKQPIFVSFVMGVASGMPARISLTASACFVLCTGLYTLLLIAIVLTGCLTVLTGIAHHTGRPPVSPLHQGVCFLPALIFKPLF